jgi:hypothetical protein
VIAFHRVGRSLRFDPADVAAYLARQRRPARGERPVASCPERYGNSYGRLPP